MKKVANRYANLVGTNKIKNEYTKINIGFDVVQADMDAEIAAREKTDANLAQEVINRKSAVQAVDNRVDQIIQGGGPDKDAELVDIRTPDPSYTPQRTINVAGDLTRDMQSQFVAHKAETVTGLANVKSFGAKGDGVTDDTAAIQAAINTGKSVYLPPGVYKHTSLTISTFGQSIIGAGQLYGGSQLLFIGTGTAITVLGATNYLRIQNLRISGKPIVPTDYYNTGDVGIDITKGNTSVVMDSVWINNFEMLVKSNYNSFYNKFINCRFEMARICLHQFSDNNFEIRGCRFEKFSDATLTNGWHGPQVIRNCSFETFNGAIVNRTGTEQGLVVFQNNYVEIHDTENLPTNFPNKEATGAKPGKFGGNILFAGPFGNLILKDNELQLGGVFRIMSASACDNLESTGNNIHLYTAGNNLNSLFASVTTFKSYNINDRLGFTLGASGGYSQNYSQGALDVISPYNQNYFYDCVIGKERIAPQRIHTPTLQSGWTSTDVNYGPPRVYISKEGLYFQGLLDGSTKTGNVVFTLPANALPFEYGTSRAYCNVTSFANYGDGNIVRFRYLYNSGVLQLENAPASLANIRLDGLFIPLRV